MLRWLRVPSRNEYIDLHDAFRKLENRVQDIERQTNEDRRFWKLIYSGQKGLAAYLGLEEYREHIPDFSYQLPPQERTIEIVRFKKAPAKNKTGGIRATRS